MTAKELTHIIALGETSRVQFKREFDNQDKIAAEIIAMSNTKGGVLIFGVEDKTGKSLGLDYAALQSVNNRVATIANDLIKPPVYLTTEAVSLDDNINVLVVSIGEGINKPYKDTKGAIWIKQGADKRRLLDNAEIMRLFQQSGNLFADELEVYDTGIDDVDERLFAAYFNAEFGQTYQERGLTYEQALRVKKVLRGGRTTLAGLLFFGRNPQNVKPILTVKTVSFLGNKLSGNEFRNKPEDLQGTIPELFKQGMMFLKSNLRYYQKDKDFNSKGVLEISEIALREVLQNALVHRDYFKSSPVRLFVFDNRVELVSPGNLPNSLTVEEARYGNPVSRNPQITSFAVHTLPYSGLGSGLRRAFEQQPNIELINDKESEQFIVKIPRLINSE